MLLAFKDQSQHSILFFLISLQMKVNKENTAFQDLLFLRMSRGLSKLAYFWFILATFTVLIDLTYVLTRPKAPATSAEHPLASTFPFSGWTLYTQFDKRYAPNDDAFVVVQSWCNAGECVLQLLAVMASLASAYAFAHKVTVVVCVMVTYKTIMYALMEFADGSKFTQHNTTKDLLTMVVIPSSFWIIVPLILLKRSINALSLRPVPLSSKKAK